MAMERDAGHLEVERVFLFKERYHEAAEGGVHVQIHVRVLRDPADLLDGIDLAELRRAGDRDKGDGILIDEAGHRLGIGL